MISELEKIICLFKLKGHNFYNRKIMDKNKFKSNQKPSIWNKEKKLGKAFLQKAFANTI